MYKQIFAERLLKARKDANMTQREAAERINIGQPKMSKLENGTQEPDIEMLGQLAELYEVSTDWLLGIGKKKDKEQ